MAGLDSIYIYNYYSYCKDFYKNCYFILNIASLIIGITSSIIIKITSKINKNSYRDFCGYYYKYYYKSYYKGFYKGYYKGNIGLISS